MSGDETAKAIQALNRGVDRAGLRERKQQLLLHGPRTQEIAQLDQAGVREEICELSIFFIEDTWPQLKTLLASQGALLLRPDPDPTRAGFVPVTAEDLGDGVEDDPLSRIAGYAEVLLRAIGRFVERRQANQAFTDFTQAQAGRPSRSALFVRYFDLLARLEPPESPTSHGIVNGLAGLQVTLALAEVIPIVYQRQHGSPIPRSLLQSVLAAPALMRLILAIASTRSQASNAILAELMGPSFATWSHSLLPRADGTQPRRLRLLPECFYLSADEELPTLQLHPEVLARIRQRTAELETPGRTRQLMCPAFFAYSNPAGSGAEAQVPVIQDFVGWLLEMMQRYYVRFF